MSPDETKQVLRNKLKSRSGQTLMVIVDSTCIERERLIAFRRGGELTKHEITRLTTRLLHGERNTYWAKVTE
jgi:hypothetical protein